MPSSHPLPLTFYDSFKKSLVTIKPEKTVVPNTLKMYHCGPTVYNYQHIGNLQGAMLADTIAKVAGLAGWNVEFVENITDVGHLVGDGDDGQNVANAEDKLEKGAKREGKKVSEIVDFYTQNYRQQAELIGLEIPSGKMNPKATEYIKEQMILALTLLKEGKAYLSEDGIYYRSGGKTPQSADADSPLQGALLGKLQNQVYLSRDEETLVPLVVSITPLIPLARGKERSDRGLSANYTKLYQDEHKKSANLEALNQKGHFKINYQLEKRAKEMRKNMTKSEQNIWFNLLKGKKLGYKFLKQQVIFNYILDFYCSELLLAIEIDGDSHNGESNQQYDQQRDQFLQSCGVKIIRYTNQEILNNLDGVYEDLKQKIGERKVELKGLPIDKKVLDESLSEDNQEDVIDDLVQKIQQLAKEKQGKPLIIAIDGRGGSGKSTLARELQTRIMNSVHVHLDEFHFPKSAGANKNYDYERLERDLLKPFINSQSLIKYQKYNFGQAKGLDFDGLDEVVEINNKNVLILDGFSTINNKIKAYFDLTIWLESDPHISMNRAIKRNENEYNLAPMSETSKNKWLEGQNRWVQENNPQQNANIIISTQNGGYKLVEDRTQLTEFAKKVPQLIPLWWQHNFPDEALASWQTLDGGQIAVSVILNQKYVLKILGQKYHWAKTQENEYQKILENYKTVQADFDNRSFIPKILEIREKDEIFGVPLIVSEFLPLPNLANIYHQFPEDKKQIILSNFIDLLKNFHNQTIVENSHFNTTSIFNFALESYKQCSDKVDLRQKDKLEDFFENYQIKNLITSNAKIHNDFHFGNILFDQSSNNLFLIDFDWLDLQPNWIELRGLFQALFLPMVIVEAKLEKYYQEPLYQEFISLIKVYPELLPKDKLEEIKLLFIDIFIEKLTHPKFQKQTTILFDLVFKFDSLELLATQKWKEATDLFEKYFEKPDQQNSETIQKLQEILQDLN